MNILLIDDIMEDQKILADILEGDGHNIVTAKNREEVNELLSEDDIDLVIANTGMSVMTEEDMVDYVQRHHNNIPLINAKEKFGEWAESRQAYIYCAKWLDKGWGMFGHLLKAID